MIRSAAERDASGVLAIYEPIVRDTPISFETEPPTEDEMAARIARSHEWLIIEHDRHVIGYAYAAPFIGALPTGGPSRYPSTSRRTPAVRG
jgi:phosphinothricin acetyltransferase